MRTLRPNGELFWRVDWIDYFRDSVRLLAKALNKYLYPLLPANKLLYSVYIFFNKRPSSLSPRAFGHAGWIVQKLLCRILPAYAT